MTKTIRVSAPGKAILHGEHAVVYGKAAIAVSINLRTVITLRKEDDDKITLNFLTLNEKREWKVPTETESGRKSCEILPFSEENLTQYYKLLGDDKSDSDDIFSKAESAFIYLYCAISTVYGKGSHKAVNLQISTDLPLSAGLGSSASYSVALSTALLYLYEQLDEDNGQDEEKKDLINKWAFQSERVLHGKPSGIDNSTCTYGGALFFKNGQICETLNDLPQLNIFLVNSNIPRNTKKMVSDVRNKREKYPDVFNAIMNSIEFIALHQWNILKSFSKSKRTKIFLDTFDELVPVNQHLLNAIGVGHNMLDKICAIAKEYSFPAKLTGAGGGGCALIFLNRDNDESKNEVKKALETEGFSVLETELAGSGVTISSD